ncbi:unnamed protein product [Umbelopsis ramanniana]
MADSPATTPKGTVRRRVTSRSNSNAPRGAIPGGSTSGMMRIYSDDSPGLRRPCCCFGFVAHLHSVCVWSPYHRKVLAQVERGQPFTLSVANYT